MKTEYIKHHVSGKTISGYGVTHLIKMYNLHSINECNFHRLVPGNIEEVRSVEDYVKENFIETKKPVQVQTVPKTEEKKTTTKKVVKKKTTKK